MRRRSAIYVPGSNMRAMHKAASLGADAIIYDLEDSVAPQMKSQARENVAVAVDADHPRNHERVVRINGISTEEYEADLTAAIAAKPDAILVPKVSRPDELLSAQRAIDAGSSPISLWAMIETPLAIGNLFAIAESVTKATPALSCLVLGTNDLVKDMRMPPPVDRQYIRPALLSCVAAARAYGLTVLDGVFNGLDAGEQYEMECREGRALGMDGKTLIHPGQIDLCNQIFSQSDRDRDWARRVINAFEAPENASKGAIRVDGEMLERLHLAVARRILSS